MLIVQKGKRIAGKGEYVLREQSLKEFERGAFYGLNGHFAYTSYAAERFNTPQEALQTLNSKGFSKSWSQRMSDMFEGK